MGSSMIGLAGMAGLLVLILLRVPVGIAMGLVGFFGYAAIDGWGGRSVCSARRHSMWQAATR